MTPEPPETPSFRPNPLARFLALPILLLIGACAPALTAADGSVTTDNVGIGSFFDDPRLAHADWGVLIESLSTGEVLYARDPGGLMVPASNVKLITGAAALATLGPRYTYTTTISASGERRDGVLDGSLVVTGTGDPTFSGRFQTDPRDVFRQWADSLRNRGITRVVGGIIAVDTAFSGPTLGDGWMWDDLPYGASAEFGALQFNEGTVELDIFPSSSDLQPAIAVLDPPTQYVRIINDTRTMPSGSVSAIRLTRDEAGPAILIEGEVAADDDGFSRTVAVRNPALFFATVLRETLREQGISVEGPAAHYSEIGLIDATIREAFPLFTHQSPPLSEILPAMMKPSQNQIAETLLRTVGREMRGSGSDDAGVAAVDSLFEAWGLGDEPYRMADASGLSRYNLMSPRLFVGVLRAMDASPYREIWHSSLTVAGVDGTLESRMKAAPLYNNLHGKTGTMSGIRSLSGYLRNASGDTIVFSTMVNNSVLSSSVADEIAEAALEAVARQ